MACQSYRESGCTCRPPVQAPVLVIPLLKAGVMNVPRRSTSTPVRRQPTSSGRHWHRCSRRREATTGAGAGPSSETSAWSWMPNADGIRGTGDQGLHLASEDHFPCSPESFPIAQRHMISGGHPDRLAMRPHDGSVLNDAPTQHSKQSITGRRGPR